MTFNRWAVESLIHLFKITNQDDVMGIKGSVEQHLAVVLESLSKIAQKRWLRPAGTERWDLQDSPILKEHRNDILRLLKTLGFVDQVKPTQREYDCVLLLGATDVHLLKRIQYLNKLWDEGVRYQKVYFLSGGTKIQNDLHCFTDIDSSLNVKLETDTALIMEIYQTIHVDHGRKIEVIPIVASKKQLRANTEDTLKAWLEEKQKAKSVLVNIFRQCFSGCIITRPGCIKSRFLGPARICYPQTLFSLVQSGDY